MAGGTGWTFGVAVKPGPVCRTTESSGQDRHLSNAMMLGMSDRRQGRSFDPNSPGAQRLLVGARAALHPPPAAGPMDPIDIVLTTACSLRGCYDTQLVPRQPGDRVTVWRFLANTMARDGEARLAD